jgi:hypothetical protein
MNTEFPTITAGTYGRGRVVYFANQTDKMCHMNGHDDFVDTFNNAVNWVKSGELSVATDAPDSVHIALTEKQGDASQSVLSLVNLTSAPRRPIKQLLPVYSFNVDVRLKGNALAEYRVLKQDGDIKLTVIGQDGDEIVVRVEVSMLREFAGIYFRTV